MLLLLMIAAAVALLLRSVLSGHIWPAWAALGLCLVGLALLGLRVLPSRRATPEEATDEGDDESGTDNGPFGGAALGDDPDEPVVAAGNGANPEPDTAATAGSDLVRVVTGGRRFHNLGCRLVADREADELTRAEALAEGFSACTVCGGKRMTASAGEPAS